MSDKQSGLLLKALLEIIHRPESSYAERLQTSAIHLAEFFSAGRCSIMIADREELILEVKASTHPEIIGLRRSVSDVSIATRAYLDNEPFYADEKRRSFFRPLEKSVFSSKYNISIPICYQTIRLGVFNLTDTIGDTPLSASQKEMLLTAIQCLAVFIYAEQTRESIERKVCRIEDEKERLVERDEMKSNLINYAIHDMKGPITTIMANLDLLCYENLTPDQSEYLKLAVEDVYKLERLVRNILDLTRLEEGKIVLTRNEVDIHDLVRMEIIAFENLAMRKNVHIVLNSEPYTCYLDEDLVGRTVSNLLRNAIEYSPEGSQITVDVWNDQVLREVLVSVSDQGCGVPEEYRLKIFDKFFQINSSDIHNVMTTGLGLAFCRLVVMGHGGKIWVEDAPGGGARFVFKIPEIIKGVIG